MAKKHKKRTKRYTGDDAKTTGVAGQNKPVVHRYEAVQRSAAGQWLYEHKRAVKYTLIVLGITAFVALIITGIVQSTGR